MDMGISSEILDLLVVHCCLISKRQRETVAIGTDSYFQNPNRSKHPILLKEAGFPELKWPALCDSVSFGRISNQSVLPPHGLGPFSPFPPPHSQPTLRGGPFPGVQLSVETWLQRPGRHKDNMSCFAIFLSGLYFCLRSLQ